MSAYDKNYYISVNDATHYINAELKNMRNTGVFKVCELVDIPYEILDAEYLLFEEEDNEKLIKIKDIDKILLCIIETQKKGFNVKHFNIDKVFIIFINQILM